jgi:hypothetical protein
MASYGWEAVTVLGHAFMLAFPGVEYDLAIHRILMVELLHIGWLHIFPHSRILIRVSEVLVATLTSIGLFLSKTPFSIVYWYIACTAIKFYVRAFSEFADLVLSFLGELVHIIQSIPAELRRYQQMFPDEFQFVRNYWEATVVNLRDPFGIAVVRLLIYFLSVPQRRNVLRPNGYPSFVLSANLRDPGPCSICHQPLRNDTAVRNLSCDHMFHAVCIDPWIIDNPSCPNCRARVE